jgi:GH24 family phage-related lysozyme (muramidase)
VDRTREYISGHEGGKRNKVYPDSLGIMTIGIGMNLEEQRSKDRIIALGIDYAALMKGVATLEDRHIDILFAEDFDVAINDAIASVKSYDKHPPDVQMALVDMSFQLGGPRLRKFVKMLDALNSEPPDYNRAADEVADSLYAKQTPNRAADNIALLRSAAG